MGSISSSSSPAAPTPFVPTLEVEVLPFLRGLAVLQMQMGTNAENVSFAFLSCKRREKGKRWGEEEEKVGLRGGRGNGGGGVQNVLLHESSSPIGPLVPHPPHLHPRPLKSLLPVFRPDDPPEEGELGVPR